MFPKTITKTTTNSKKTEDCRTVMDSLHCKEVTHVNTYGSTAVVVAVLRRISFPLNPCRRNSMKGNLNKFLYRLSSPHHLPLLLPCLPISIPFPLLNLMQNAVTFTIIPALSDSRSRTRSSSIINRSLSRYLRSLPQRLERL